MDSLAPHILVQDMRQTIDFYQELGFDVTMRFPEEGEKIAWGMMCSGNVVFIFQTFESFANELPMIKKHDGVSLLFYIKLKNIKAYYENIKHKVSVLKVLERTFYGTNEFSIQDNHGYVLRFSEDEQKELD